MDLEALRLYTIGHSSRTFDELHALLDRHGIELLVDVRRFPGSRRQPWFSQDELHDALVERGIGYRHLRELGGRRTADEHATEAWGGAWRNTSFRAYAEHAQSATFRHGIETLLDLADDARTAIMCSEAVPWRCHRWLISDVVAAMGVDVVHVVGDGAAHEHLVSSFAHVAPDGRVTWPGPESDARLRLGAPVVAGTTRQR